MENIVFNVGGVNIEMDKEVVSKAIETGTVEIKTDELITYQKEEFETFKTNLANQEYKNGKTAGAEMLIKDAREKFELEFEGKTLDNFADAFKSKVITEAKAEPSKKIQELTDNFNNLQSNYNNLNDEYTGFKETISQKETQSKKDNTLLSMMPDSLMVDKDIALIALKTKTGIDVQFSEDGTPLQVVNGQVRKDKSLEPLTLNKDFITDQLSELNLLKKVAGSSNGDGDSLSGGKAGSYEAFVKEMENNNIPIGSEKFQLEMNKRVSDKTLTF